MEKKFCDLCKGEIVDGIDRVFIITYGEKCGVMSFKKHKKGEVCYECIKKIMNFMDNLKK